MFLKLCKGVLKFVYGRLKFRIDWYIILVHNFDRQFNLSEQSLMLSLNVTFCTIIIIFSSSGLLPLTFFCILHRYHLPAPFPTKAIIGGSFGVENLKRSNNNFALNLY